MKQTDLQKVYRDRIEGYENAIGYRTRVINYISLLRFITLVAVVYFFVKGITADHLIYFFGSFLMAISFLMLIAFHKLHRDKRELLHQLRKLNSTEIDCLNHQYLGYPDGSEFTDRHHPWTYDLDIFGKGSLYQYISRTATLKGKKTLAGMLTSVPEITELIHERQEIVRELKDRIDFRQMFTARANLFEERDSDLPELKSWLETDCYIQNNRWLVALSILSTGASLAILAAGIVNPSHFRFFLPLLFINWGILAFFLQRTNKYHSNLSRKHELLSGYACLLETIGEPDFSHPTLLFNQDNAGEGCEAIGKLSRLLNFFDQRLNFLVGAILNSLFLFDFFMLHQLEKWKMKNRDNIEAWIDLTGWMEAMVSLSGFAYNHPGYAFPEIGFRRHELIAESMGHPLIPPSKRVDNDIRITEEKIIVITGANMAGKSTFLRTIGINIILGYLGCPVCASRFETGFWNLFTSMRTSDSLKDEESYFLAEIRRLKEIMNKMQEGEPLLVLLDEVLKGTNTTDKQKGSIGLIEKSLNYSILCFIATHDLALGKLEELHRGAIANYCFESQLTDLDVTFDYKIARGIARNMNASFLMKKMGIVD